MATKMMPPMTPPAIAPAVDAVLFGGGDEAAPLMLLMGMQLVWAHALHVLTEREHVCPSGHLGQAGIWGGHATQFARRRNRLRAALESDASG